MKYLDDLGNEYSISSPEERLIETELEIERIKDKMQMLWNHTVKWGKKDAHPEHFEDIWEDGFDPK